MLFLFAAKLFFELAFFVLLGWTVYFIYRFYKNSPNDNPDKKKLKGTGITLAIVYVIKSFLSFF